jgi:biotin transport system substrate-specific component
MLSLHRLVWLSLMAALIAVGAFIQFPIGPVPFSLQTLFVLLAGLILGSKHGAASAALYVVAGLVLPIYAGGRSGLNVLLGPTGGYLIGFIGAAYVVGCARRGKGNEVAWPQGIGWALLALIPIYGFGVPRLKMAMDIGWNEALLTGLWPFLPGAAVKILLAVAVVRFMQKRSLLP